MVKHSIFLFLLKGEVNMKSWFNKVFKTSIFDRMNYTDRQCRLELEEENKKAAVRIHKSVEREIFEDIDVEIKFFDDTKIRKKPLINRDSLMEILDDPNSTKEDKMRANAQLKDLNKY